MAMNEYYYQVFDGMYASELFVALADAQADAIACVSDEGFSGEAVIGRYEIGDGGSGAIVARYTDDSIIETPDSSISAHRSHKMHLLWVDRSNEELRRSYHKNRKVAHS